MDAHEAEILGIAMKALRYCSTPPERLHPENNLPYLVASIALADIERLEQIRLNHSAAPAERKEG